MIYPQKTVAGDKKFTAAEVLTWEAESQDWYFQVSTGMAAALASQNNSPAALCINDWYFRTDAIKAEQNDYIRTIMRRFPDYHPTLVMISVLEKECGSLTFTD